MCAHETVLPAWEHRYSRSGPEIPCVGSSCLSSLWPPSTCWGILSLRIHSLSWTCHSTALWHPWHKGPVASLAQGHCPCSCICPCLTAAVLASVGHGAVCSRGQWGVEDKLLRVWVCRVWCSSIRTEQVTAATAPAASDSWKGHALLLVLSTPGHLYR